MLPTKRRRNWSALGQNLVLCTVLVLALITRPGWSGPLFIAYAAASSIVLMVYLRRWPNLARRLGDPIKGDAALEALLKQGPSAASVLLKTLRVLPVQTRKWDGYQARRRAANGLGILGAPEATGPLIGTLSDPDPELRACAVRALGNIGDRRAIPALMVMLFDDDGTVSSSAQQAMRRMSEGELVDNAMMATVGDSAAKAALARQPREAIIAMLIAGAHHGRIGRIGCIDLLAELGASEAIPTLRGVARGITVDPRVKQAALAALVQLEPLAGLPRAAEATVADTSTLPVPAQPTVSLDALPRAVQEQD